MSGMSADSPSSPDRTAEGPAGRSDMSGRSVDSLSSRLTVEIVSEFGRSIAFVGRLTGAIHPAGHLYICLVCYRDCYDDP